MKPDSSSDIRDAPKLYRAYREIEEQHPDWSPERVAQEFANRVNAGPELNDALLEVVLKAFIQQHPSVETH
jgi:hypothetical protein